MLAALTLMIGILAGCDSASESGTQYSLTETAGEVRSGGELVMNYESSPKVFVG